MNELSARSISQIFELKALDQSQSHRKEDAFLRVLYKLDATVTRLETTMEHQVNRLASIECVLGEVIASKFDTLISLSRENNSNGRRSIKEGFATNRESPTEKKSERQSSKHPQRQPNDRSLAPKSKPNVTLRYTKFDPQSDISDIDASPRVELVRQSLVQPAEKESQISAKNRSLEKTSPFTLSMPLIPIKSTTENVEGYIRRSIGDIVNTRTQALYQEFISGKLLPHDLKARYAWEIIRSCLDFSKFIKQLNLNANHHQRTRMVAIVDQSLRNSLEFLVEKYPPSRHKIVDSSLIKHITQIRKHNDLQYDMLRNARMSFVDDTRKQDFTREIKEWLNKIVREIQRVFPKFKEDMRELFRGELVNFSEREEDLQFDIGCKINQHTEVYSESELETPGLEIKSPQVARVLVKWIEELSAMLLRPAETLEQIKSGFKNTTKKAAIYLSEGMKETLVSKINTITAKTVIPRWKEREHSLLTYVNEITTLVQPGFFGHEQLNRQEVVALSAARCMNIVSNVHILLTLNSLLESLNSVRKCFGDSDIMANLDLISCNILDLVRCKCVGTKKDIKKIYEDLVRSPNYEIIRVKIKLNESTRDILINFKCKDSFLIGEMQLALGSKDALNEKFCHQLYELQRSVFPVLYEVSTQIVSHDYRSNFAAKHLQALQFKPASNRDIIDRHITFEQTGLRCSFGHESVQMVYRQNSMPFCCSLCARFFEGYRFGLEFLTCSYCATKVCPKCAIGKDLRMQHHYLDRHVKWARICSFVRAEEAWFGFTTEEELTERLDVHLKKTPYVVAVNINSAGASIRVLKIHEKIIMESLLSQTNKITSVSNHNPQNWSCILTPTHVERVALSKIKLLTKLMVDGRSWYEVEKQLLTEGTTDIICVPSSIAKEVLVLDVPSDYEAITNRLQLQSMRMHIMRENLKAEGFVELTSKRLQDLKILNEVTQPASIRSINLWDNYVVDISSLKIFTGLQQLVLRQNCISHIEDRLPFEQLRILNLQRNRLKGSLPRINLPKLTLLDISKNELTDVDSLGLQSLKDLEILYMSINQLNRLPVLNCPALETYSFATNSITSLKELAEGNTPKLRRVKALTNKIAGQLPILNFNAMQEMQLQDNFLTGISNLSRSRLPYLQKLYLSKNLIAGELPTLDFNSLKNFLLDHNKLESFGSIKSWRLPALVQLDISNNALKEPIPEIDLPSLVELQLSNNRITDISGLNASKVPQLKTLIISFNQIQSVPLLHCDQLQVLDLSNNSIGSVENLSALRASSLQRLYLQNNLLIGSVPILELPCLEELILDGNDIKKLECLYEPQLLPAIRKISVKENRQIDSLGEEILFGEGDMEAKSRNLLRNRILKYHFLS